ncbi:MAG: hypothetical protein D6690_17615 [Nitrospirae bacterium]|nr:MAG: hypothetical protein D6690_17615 [Nitrospirota bacterium]
MVVMCLTWALVLGMRFPRESPVRWIQAGALLAYLLAAVTAIASESGGLPVNIHRPFSILAQVFIALALFRVWGKHRLLTGLNLVAWLGILSDTALHYLLAR